NKDDRENCDRPTHQTPEPDTAHGLHSRILKTSCFPEFHRAFGEALKPRSLLKRRRLCGNPPLSFPRAIRRGVKRRAILQFNPLLYLKCEWGSNSWGNRS